MCPALLLVHPATGNMMLGFLMPLLMFAIVTWMAAMAVARSCFLVVCFWVFGAPRLLSLAISALLTFAAFGSYVCMFLLSS